MSVDLDFLIKELAYKNLCSFEKKYSEDISLNKDSSISLKFNESKFLELDPSTKDTISKYSFSAQTYKSYEELFNNRYKDDFLKSISAIDPNTLEKNIGQENLILTLKKDTDLKRRYLESIKDVDLDNDGVPDRIDINDSDSSVQTISDLSIRKSSTSKETNRKNELSFELDQSEEKQDKKQKKRDELEL